MPIADIARVYRRRLDAVVARREHERTQPRVAPGDPAPLPVSFENKFRQAAAVVDERHADYETVGRQLWSPATMLSSELFDRRQGSLAAGHAIIDACRRDAEGFAVVPHAFQITLIEFWLELSGPAIYGAETWGQHHEAIRRRNGWSTPNNGVGAVQSGRKDGKSTGIAMCVVLGMLNIPEYKVSVFAKVHKQSRIILGLVAVLARGHRRIKEFKVPRSNVNEFSLVAGDNDVRCVRAHSGDGAVRTRFFCVCTNFCKAGGPRALFLVFALALSFCR